MWQCEIKHDGLHKYRVVKGATQEIMRLRADMQMRAWNEQWQRVLSTRSKQQIQMQAIQSKQLAAIRTSEAEKALDDLGHLLSSALENDHSIDWDQLKDRSQFPDAAPIHPTYEVAPREIPSTDHDFQPRINLLARVVPTLRQKAETKARLQLSQAQEIWLRSKTLTEQRNAARAEDYEKNKAMCHTAEAEWLVVRDKRNTAIEESKRGYLARKPEAVAEYGTMVLNNSYYPDSFPREARIDYIKETRTVVVDSSLPGPFALPTLKEVKYIATREAFQEVRVSEAWLNRTYDAVIYQIALRSLYELFQSDVAGALGSVVFNGWVNSIDKATGNEVNACILSLHTTKTEFMSINLAQVDPKACFKKLKGVSASKLTALQPVRPILFLNREDSRFVQAYDVVEGLNASSNLAAMDWEDFEHLIRQLFEQEFSKDGAEVRITQASRDGGVDAIVFDPDPIRGGKIVIQAKRYTNTVGVSAVRDLFGTVHNEGANKGILVTSADYGSDSYEFAKGKPIALVSGSELLGLLEKHGHKARIDLKEARLLAAEADKARGLFPDRP